MGSAGVGQEGPADGARSAPGGGCHHPHAGMASTRAGEEGPAGDAADYLDGRSCRPSENQGDPIAGQIGSAVADAASRRKSQRKSRRAQQWPVVVSTAVRERSADKVTWGTMPTVQLPTASVAHSPSLLIRVARVATCTVSTIEGPRPLKWPRPPSIVAILKARRGG